MGYETSTIPINNLFFHGDTFVKLHSKELSQMCLDITSTQTKESKNEEKARALNLNQT